MAGRPADPPTAAAAAKVNAFSLSEIRSKLGKARCAQPATTKKNGPKKKQPGNRSRFQGLRFAGRRSSHGRRVQTRPSSRPSSDAGREREREKPRWLTPPGGRRPKRWWRSAGVSDWRQGRHPRTTEIPSCILLFGSRWRCGLLHLLLLLLYDFDFDFGFVSPWLPHSGRRPAPPSAIGSQPRFLRPPNECGRVPPNQEN